jgi:hypothetical protein
MKTRRERTNGGRTQGEKNSKEDLQNSVVGRQA